MNYISVCFGINFTVRGELPSNIEKIYQNEIKKLFFYLYSHETLFISVFIPGLLLEWFEKKHPEVLDVLSELVKRKQVEVLGGGYYEPLFPLLLPVDRVGQIEHLTTKIRKLTGKRPRGITFAESIWDPSLISSCNSCGIEYALLDSRLVPKSTYRPIATYSPLIVEDLGRTLAVIPLHQGCVPSKKQNPEDFYTYLNKLKNNTSSSVFATFFTPHEFAHLCECGWMDSFLQKLNNEKFVALSTPHAFLKENCEFSKTFIPAGCLSDAAMWTLEPFVPHPKVFSESLRPTVRDFLSMYPESQKLYSRMMHVSFMVSQCRGDKTRRKAAREYLWVAQNYAVYLFTGKGGITDQKLRQQAYKYLIYAEKLVRESVGFVNNTTSFDFNFDGINEYVNRFTTYNAFLSSYGGVITELDIIHNSTNYCNVMSRIQKHDGITDTYAKEMFVDHFIQKNKQNNFDFSPALLKNPLQNIYATKKVGISRQEIILKTTITLSNKKDQLALTKKYAFTENGILVQYILQNNSDKDIKGFFAVENNFSIPFTHKKNIIIEVLVDKKRCCPSYNEKYIEKEHVSLLQITDANAKNSFVLEPNENAGLFLEPLFSARPLIDSEDIPRLEANSAVFFWDITIPAAKEIEKNIYLGINTAKKKPVAKKTRKQ